jgi:hypothetical protein
VAPGPDVNDPGNKWDTDATYEAIEAHNARLRAACPAE